MVPDSFSSRSNRSTTCIGEPRTAALLKKFFSPVVTTKIRTRFRPMAPYCSLRKFHLKR